MVISPLVALMADQVAGLEARGITSCVSINGLLSMPERSDALDRVRLGDVGILIVSPEQLRSRALRKVLAQREIGAWVLTRRTVSPNGAMTSALTIVTSAASSKRRPARTRCLRCYA